MLNDIICTLIVYASVKDVEKFVMNLVRLGGLQTLSRCRLSLASQTLTYEASCRTLFEATVPLRGSLITRPAHT